MSLATYKNIEEHFEAIDCSIFYGELLMDREAVAEMKAYLASWNKAIDDMIDLNVEEDKLEKSNCDYSVYDILDGTTTYKRFPHESPMFNATPKQMQESAEYLIATWNSRSATNVYTLERMWWNGER